jgi:hypothetical protein
MLPLPLSRSAGFLARVFTGHWGKRIPRPKEYIIAEVWEKALRRARPLAEADIGRLPTVHEWTREDVFEDPYDERPAPSRRDATRAEGMKARLPPSCA